jgi:hypothetical protein
MCESACTLDAGRRRNALIRLERNSIFLPKLPRNSGLATGADCDMLGKRPGHSHSIVSSTRKHLNTANFVSGRANFTVRSTVKKCCLGAKEGDRCRKGRGASAAMRRE